MKENIDVFNRDIWEKSLLVQIKKHSVFANIIDRDYTGDVENQGDSVFVDDKEILMDRHKYFAFRVDDIGRVQADEDLRCGYAAQGGRGMGIAIDTDVSRLITDESIRWSAGRFNDDSYDDINEEIIKHAHYTLDARNAPKDDRYLIVSPEQFAIMKYNNVSLENVFISQSLPGVRGGGEAIITPDYQAGMLIHKDAFALCLGKKVRVQAAYDTDYLSTSVVGDYLYGYGILNADFAVQVRTRI